MEVTVVVVSYRKNIELYMMRAIVSLLPCQTLNDLVQLCIKVKQ